VESGLLLPQEKAMSIQENAATLPQLQVSKYEEIQRLQGEKAQLEEQVRVATKSIADLRSMNAKLHAFVVDSSVAEAGRTT
jgi:predicted nuclease with TOPRIM domain